MARIPYVDPAAAPDDVRRILDALPVKLNVFHMMAHATTSFRPLLMLGTTILAQQKLAAKLRELVILHVATLSPARYEWVQHVPIARAAGATEAQVDAVGRGALDAACFDEVERAVLRFTTEVVRNVRASDAAFAAVAAHLSHQEIVELVLAIGYYMLVARLLETMAVDVDEARGLEVLESSARAAERSAK